VGYGTLAYLDLSCPLCTSLPNTTIVFCLGFCSAPIQLGLQVQVGHDVSSVKDGMKSVKDDVSAVKDGVKAVEEEMHLYKQAS